MIKMPHPAQFQFVVQARVKKGNRPTRDQIRMIVEHWIEGTQTPPPGWKISVIIWDGGKQREITEIDESSRGAVLQETLRRGLPRATFRVNTMGRN